MRIFLFVFIFLSSCRVLGPVNMTFEEAANEHGLEWEYKIFQSTFESPIQPVPERPKPPTR